MEVGRMAESTKGVEERTIKGPRGKEEISAREGKRGMAAGSKRRRRTMMMRRRKGGGKGGQGEEPSNLHPATAPDLGRTNH